MFKLQKVCYNNLTKKIIINHSMKEGQILFILFVYCVLHTRTVYIIAMNIISDLEGFKYFYNIK